MSSVTGSNGLQVVELLVTKHIIQTKNTNDNKVHLPIYAGTNEVPLTFTSLSLCINSIYIKIFKNLRIGGCIKS